MEPISKEMQNQIYNIGMRAEMNKQRLGIQSDMPGFESMYHNIFGGGDSSYQAPQMDMSDIEEDAMNSIDQSKMENGWILDDVRSPEVVEEEEEPEEVEEKEINFSVPPENVHISEKLKKRLEEAEKQEKVTVPSDKIVNTLMKIIHRDVKKQIIQGFQNRREIFNDTKLENEIKNWYWGVGFVAVEVEDNLITIVVHRPNKFIGKSNYLYSFRNTLKNFGYNVELKKAPNDELYNAFFGE